MVSATRWKKENNGDENLKKKKMHQKYSHFWPKQNLVQQFIIQINKNFNGAVLVSEVNINQS